jgi:hypothetical protein
MAGMTSTWGSLYEAKLSLSLFGMGMGGVSGVGVLTSIDCSVEVGSDGDGDSIGAGVSGAVVGVAGWQAASRKTTSSMQDNKIGFGCVFMV